MIDHTPMDLARIESETFLARVEHHAALGSTNDRARQLAERGDGPRPLLVIADRQTAGRGRGANRWWTGPGSVAMSLLLAPESLPADPRQGPLVSLATALAVIETVRPRLPDRTVGLHWPNDVMVEGRKLCGILVEALASREHVIGIGINVNNAAADAPPELRDRIASLGDFTGEVHDRTDLVIGILGRFARLLDDLARRPESIAHEADAACLQRGQTLRVEHGNEVVAGRCVGIVADGAMALDTPAGRRLFFSGTVSMSVE